MTQSLLFIVDALSGLYISMFALRFILQWIRASYQSPLAQFVLQVTAPLVVPARRLLPSVRGIDLPTLVVIFLLECVATLLLYAIVSFVPPIDAFLVTVLLRLVTLTLWLYCTALFVYVVMSWFGGGMYNPSAATLAEVVEPLLRPFRRLLPPIAGFDVSPVIVLVLLQAVIYALPRGL
ncbi:MAG TPA: YggT family protein [Gammaproteobacteria bacterium]|nr:YggT family protein [Gammaproteobacteria bacterium]